MQKISLNQVIEQFHLLFLNQLGSQLDKRLYAVKGGCNLRFFFDSIRYSEDLDIDVKTIAQNTLKNKVDKILASTALNQILKLRHIEINYISTPKQTSTTQSWKILLMSNASSQLLNTKIEFSRLGIEDPIELSIVDKRLITEYRMPPLYIPHYNAAAALRQKIQALIGRSETQARDIFDIHLLSNRVSDLSAIAQQFSESQRKTAINNTSSISFDQFKSQVVSYLEYAYQSQYNDKKVWQSMINFVVDLLS